MLKLVIVAALVAVTAADIDSDIYSRVVPRSRISQQCAGYCKDSSKFSLRPGWTYVYSYEGTTTSGVAGTSNDTSSIKVTAEAHIQVSQNPCELILQVREARLYDSGVEGLESARRQKQFSSGLEESPLRFSFQDGRIEQLCPAADEPTWVLNIKRGLLSAFQNSMVDLSKDAHLYERDVSGTCETTYSVKPMMWSDVKVLRRKNLHSCSGRGLNTLGLPGSHSKPKSVPIIKSEQFCEQTIKADDGTYLSNARCQETHVFAPFSNGQSGIRTSATLSLSLDNIIRTLQPFNTDLFVNKRTNLQFEFTSSSPENTVTEQDVWDTLVQLTAQSQLGVGTSVPQLFDQLVNQLTALHDQQLVKLFDEQRDKRARQFLLDALPLIGSAGSVKAMHQIFSAQEITRDELDSWLTALAFHKQPTLDMLDTLNLFLQDGIHPKAWLVVSAVVHSYCQLDPACADTPQVQAIMSGVEAMLGQSCHAVTSEQRQAVIVALKAIGNTGFISSLDTLEKCIMNEDNDLEVRLAAMSATRRFPCNKLQQLPLLQVFQGRGHDSELRIAAYLALMQCPTTFTVSIVRDTLYQEDINQVLSFVWTHLTNLQESTSSWKKEVREMLQDNFLANKFKTDARKFSRNYEMSFYSDILSTGATVDSNIVFSTKSYLPRSANLNLTLDLFGEAVNIFEVGTRLEGFESMVEDLFSPKGFFPDENMQKMLKNMKSKDDEKNEVIQTFSEQFTKGTNNEPQGTMFARVFGNELYLTQFTSLSKLLNPQTEHYSWKYLFDTLPSLLSKKNIDYTKSYRLVNTNYVIPTVLGLPLRLEVNGTATVGIQLNSEIDLQNILKTKSGIVALSINPSAAVQMDGKMTVDAFFTQAGVETKASLSSNTYLDTKVTIDRGQVINMFVNVPRDKVEVVDAVSVVYVRHREQLVEVEGVGEVSQHDSCSGEHIPTISGMRLCSQFVLRNASAVKDAPYFPLTGRFHYALVLQKSDDFTSYQLHMKQLFESINGKRSGKFLLEMDTPGSKVNRKLLADLSFSTVNGDANLELVSPMGGFQFTGKLGLSVAEKYLDLKAQVNGEEYAAVRMALQTEKVARRTRYEPSLVVQARPHLDLNLTGHLELTPATLYSGELTAVGLTEKPLSISGYVSGNKGRYDMTAVAKSNLKGVKVVSKVVSLPTVFSCKTTVKYNLRTQNVVEFEAKLQSHKKGSFSKKHLSVNLMTSEMPEYNTKATWNFYRTQKYFDSNIDVTVGITQWKSQQLYHNSLQEKNKNFEVILSLESPTKKLDYRTEIQYKTMDDTIHSHILAQLSEKNRFISRLDYEHLSPRHQLELEVATPWRRALLDARLETPPAGEVNGSVVVTWGEVGRPRWVSASGRYQAVETMLSAQHMVEAQLQGEGWSEPVLLKGEWAARSADGLILSDSQLTVELHRAKYQLEVGYVKYPSLGRHDLKVNVTLPEHSYTGSFLLINSQELKNVTVQLDLEKSVYFTSQLQLWRSFELQLFWDYLEDRSRSAVVQYRNSPQSEVAVVSMPGHYASLTVDKLGLGFSSMNITAMWGESEGSASNAILLTTYWLFDSQLNEMPTVRTHVHLTTPFIGFEHQSFMLNMNGTTTANVTQEETTYALNRDVNISTKWQNQFINFEFSQDSKLGGSLSKNLVDSTFKSRLSSSLEFLRDVNLKVNHETVKEFIPFVTTLGESWAVNAAYNDWSEFSFDSNYLPGQLSVTMDLINKTRNEVLFLGELKFVDSSLLLKSTLPLNNKIVFMSTIDWPNNFVANLTTPFKGYEISAVQYNVHVDDKNITGQVSGIVGEQFLLILTNIGKSQLGFQGSLNVSSSSSIPDLTVQVEHGLSMNRKETHLKEFASVSLTKKGKTLQSGQAFLSFTDELSSISSRTKSLQSSLQLPNHESSFNYSYQDEIKTTGIEVQHRLVHSWNKEETEASLIYEGFSSVVGILKRNDDKKFELSFKNSGNGNLRTDLKLPGGYFVKHLLFHSDHTSWENFLVVSSPSQKVIIKNVQSKNAEETYFAHKLTVSLNREVAYLDFSVELDRETYRPDTISFSATSPWNHPVTAKYEMLISTGATTKHQVEVKYKQGQEIKAILDITSTKPTHKIVFNLYSPYCKHFEGTVNLESDERNSKLNTLLKMDEKQLMLDMTLLRSFTNPLVSLNLNNSDGNIVHLLGTYDIDNSVKTTRLSALYFNQGVSFQGHYSMKANNIKAGIVASTPITGWEEITADFDSVLSKNSMFAINVSMDKKFIIFSGSGTFQSDSIKSSLSLDYHLLEEVNKYSTVFEYSSARTNEFITFSFRHNEMSIFDFYIKSLEDVQLESGHTSHSLSYKAHTPFNNFEDSSFDIRLVRSNDKQGIFGSVTVNNWKARVRGENTFDFNGTGYLDLKLSAFEHKAELYVKHVVGEKDVYSWHLSSNDDFITGSITIFSPDGALQVMYSVDSSVPQIKTVNGIALVGTTSNSFVLESASNVNNNNYIVNYKVSFGNVSDKKMEHTIWIALPLQGFENIRGFLEYSSSQTTYLKGELTDGNTSNKVSYSSGVGSWSLSADLPGVCNISSKKTSSSLELVANTIHSETVPKFSLNLHLNKTLLLLDTENSLTGDVVFSVQSDNLRKLLISGAVGKLNTNAILELSFSNEHTNLEFKSNIPKWSDVSVVTGKSVDKTNNKYTVSVSKEREELLYLTVEGFYNKLKGDGVISITTQELFIDANLNYDISSNFSVDLKYNINGNKQQAEGKISFLPDSTRIDLATPIRGFEDVSLIGNLNKKDKRVGLIFHKNGKTLGIDMSATFESKLVLLKGKVVNGQEEFVLTVGAQNGTDSEPKSSSIYINAFKNKMSVFWLSLEGSYDLENMAGVKLSFSSYYHKQLYFEVLSIKESFKHKLLFNYLYGIDVIYSLNATVIRDFCKPSLVINSRFGPQSTHVEIGYDIESPKKTIHFSFKPNGEKYVNISGEVYWSVLVSNIKFVLENKELLAEVDSILVSGEYNFDDKSTINTSLVWDDVKYFDLVMESGSLYDVEFHSSLISSKFLNSSYNVALLYKLALPDATIFSNVKLNDGYYKCSANLLWNEDSANTFFQLNTNSGYGFENAVLSAKYNTNKQSKYSHFIDFTVDDSILFHVSSAVSYPNEVSLNLILPDSLFLPFVKEISVGYNFTEELKAITFKYLSGSNDKRKFSLYFTSQGHECQLDLSRSELDTDDLLQFDQFTLLFGLGDESAYFQTSLLFENENIFNVSLNKQSSDRSQEKVRTLQELMFDIKNLYSWNITGYSGKFRFAGTFSPTEISVIAKHPASVYHEQIGLSELKYSKTIEDIRFLQAYFKNEQDVQLEFQYLDILLKIVTLINDEKKSTTFTDLTLVLNNKVISVNGEDTCEKYTFNFGSSPKCLRLKHKSKVTGLSTNPLNSYYFVDVLSGEFDGSVSTGAQNFSFGGKVKVNTKTLSCSTLDLFYNSTTGSNKPGNQFSLKYDTNCLNSIQANFKSSYDGKTRSVLIRANQDDKMIYRVVMEGANLPYCKECGVIADVSKSSQNLRVSREANFVHFQLLRSTTDFLLSVESSYHALKQLKINTETNQASGNHLGRFKLEGSRASTEWMYNVTNSKNGLLVCQITSDKDIQVNVVLDVSNKKEALVKVMKGGKSYEGRAVMNYVSEKQQIKVLTVVSVDGQDYEFNLNHYVIPQERKTSMKLKTPSDNYYVEVGMNVTDDKRVIFSAKYKTPFYPLDYADLKIDYSFTPVSKLEYFLLEELEPIENKQESYEVSYTLHTVRIALITNSLQEDAEILVMNGDLYGVSIKCMSKEVMISISRYENGKSFASHSVASVQGFQFKEFGVFEGKSILRVYVNKEDKNAFASLQTPYTESLVLIFKTAMKNSVGEDIENLVHKSFEVVLNGKTIFRVDTINSSAGFYQGSMYGEWNDHKRVRFNYNMQSEYLLMKIKLDDGEKSVVDTDLQYVINPNNAGWLRIVNLDVRKLFSLQELKPAITFQYQINNASEVEYYLAFTNGFKDGKQLFSGSCKLQYPQLRTFSIDSRPSINISIFLESFYNKYEADSEILFQRNKMNSLVKWRRTVKSVSDNQEPDYSVLTFGGFVKKSSAEFYLNENKFVGYMNSSKTQTSITAQLVNEKLNKNLTVSATVQFSPIFTFNIYHTVFDSPCSIDVRVDRRSLSIKTALTIVYNRLKQQAFTNVYLDSNPQYAELIYIDIWQQTHEASFHVEEKNNEVTVQGKINSPALDENFLIVTVGNNNDKIDINLNDEFIFKAFKDNHTGSIDLHAVGNDYKLHYSCESDVKVTVASPKVNGVVDFKLDKVNKDLYFDAEFDVNSYYFLLKINKDSIFNLTLTKESENIFKTDLFIEKDSEIFQLQFNFNILNKDNSISIKHGYSPILLVVSLNSAHFLKNNVEVVFGVKNEDYTTGVFEVKQETALFKSYLSLSKENKTIEVVIEAPLFSEMDKAKINGIFNIFDIDCEMRLSAAFSSADTLLSQASVHFIKNDEVFTSGLAMKSKFKNYEDLSVSFHLPLQMSNDMRANMIIQLPSAKPYELGFTLCIVEAKVLSSAIFRWQDLLVSVDFKNGDSPFYSDFSEWNIQYMKTKLQIGAWRQPKYPLTDYIYFLDVNDKRIIEVSHALILQQNHFKSKLTVETAFRNHEKYGIDLELQNLKSGKIVRLLGSAPQLGRDLGIDFGYSYESWMNYAVLAQIRIPHDNKIKMARLYALHKIHPGLSFSKLNYSLECTDLGVIGWEFESLAPYVWQEMSAVETKVNFNNKVFSVKAKSFIHSDKIQVTFGLETPFDKLRKGELHLSGTSQLVGSELILSHNSNELINMNVTEDFTNTKQINVLSKWRSLAVQYLYEVDNDDITANGHICWDLLNKSTSQLGVKVKLSKNSKKYENAVELILPSTYIPKLGVKTVFENQFNELFSLLQIDFPGFLLEGKLAKETSASMCKSGLQLKWAVSDRAPKNIGVFYVKERTNEEVKHYFTLQHFALVNDLMVTVYSKNTLYGVNLQYSPVKEEEISLEFGYWLVEDFNKERSGVKIVALHPASNTLIYAVANLTSSNDLTEAGVSVAYLADQNASKAKYVAFYGKKNKKTPGLFVGLTSNGNSLGVGGSIWTKENYLRGVTLEARVNQKDPLKLEVVQNTADPGVEAELSYSLSRTYRVFAGMPNNNELTAKLSHTMYGKPNLDAMASVRLNTSKILWGRFELPPMTQVGQEFYDGIMEEYSDVTLVSQAISNGLSDFLHEDFSKKIVLLLDSVSTTSDNLLKETYIEVEVVSKSFEAISNIIQQVYDDDHFYLRTMHLHLTKACSALYKYSSCAVEVVSNTLKSLFDPMLEVTSRIWEVVQSLLSHWKMFVMEMGVGGESPLKRMSELVGSYQSLRHSLILQCKQVVALAREQLALAERRSADLLTQAELAGNQLIRTVEETVAAQVQRAINYKDTILAGFYVLGNTVQGMIEIVREGIYRIKEVRYTVDWVVKCLDYINSWFTNFRLEPYLREVDMFLERVIELVVSDVEKNFGEYEVYLLRAEDILAGHYESLSKIPEVLYLRSAVNQVYQKVKWFWNYAKLNEKLKDAVDTYVENMRAALNEIEGQLDRKDGDLRSEYIYNTERNSLMFTQELPFEWPAFNQLPEFNMDTNGRPFTIPAQEYSSMVQTMANYLWQDAKLLPYLLPPFGAEALLSGDSFITFDNSFYSFRGGCGSYMLAADLYHHTFTLLANYTSNQRDLVLITRDTEIVVKNNLEIYINGKLEDLPLTLSNGKPLTMERKVHSVLIKSEEGFSLECSSFQDLCKFHLDGWFMGRTAGLFGTYNNEATDDFVRPNRELSGSIKEFTDSWAVATKTCEGEDELSTSYEDSRHSEMCELFFSSQSSPFFPCFHVVDPVAFHEMCAAAKRDNTCPAVMAYITKCISSGVQIWMPEFCGDSSIKDATMLSGYSDIVEVPSKMAADVVFVMEEASCMASNRLNFETLFSTLNTDLKTKGLTDNKFAFISFGSKAVHIQTINGHIWTEDEKQLVNVMNHLEGKEESSLYTSALELAASLPFRPGVSRSVVLVHCSSCSHSEHYASLLERFTQNDISLHILQREHIMDKKAKVVSKAIGLEKSGAYPRKRLTKNIQPNPELLKQVSVPQDLCTPIMLSTNGTMFHLDVTRKWVRAWASRVAQGAVPTNPWKQCENSFGSDNVPVWRCRTMQSSKLKEWDQTALDEYIGTSPGADLYTEYPEYAP